MDSDEASIGGRILMRVLSRDRRIEYGTLRRRAPRLAGLTQLDIGLLLRYGDSVVSTGAQ